MPTTKQVCYRNDKEVLLKVYVEKKTKKKKSSPSPLIIHQRVTEELVVVDDNGSTSRRSKLLIYSRFLRNSARGEGSSSMSLLPNYSQTNIQTPTMMTSFNKKAKHAGKPSCFGNLKFLIPSFLRSWPNDHKKKKKQGTSGNRFKKLQVLECKFDKFSAQKKNSAF